MRGKLRELLEVDREEEVEDLGGIE
jgi:hypothetical protein